MLSIEQLAAASGVSAGLISQLERELRNPSPDTGLVPANVRGDGEGSRAAPVGVFG